MALLRPHTRNSVHRIALYSAAITLGFFVRALRIVRRTLASANPAARNSSRKGTPSLAPATQANQFVALVRSVSGNGSTRINSAPNT